MSVIITRSYKLWDTSVEDFITVGDDEEGPPGTMIVMHQRNLDGHLLRISFTKEQAEWLRTCLGSLLGAMK